ncbi:MAG: TIGR04076 family protein [Desulfobacteraceae bacterium]|nr:TIGR04076 family protein [Desulfobacteraceae bacterium]
MDRIKGNSYRITATIVDIKGTCSAGHKKGDTFDISCHNPGGLCGYFYHDIFPSLQTFEFGGTMPWWKNDSMELRCPDYHNLTTIRLERTREG